SWTDRTAISQRNELGDLAARGRSTRPEIRSLLRITGLAGPTAGVTADHAMGRHRFDVAEEGAARRHVGERGCGGGGQRVAARQADHLGELAARDVGAWAEVRPILRVAGFAGASAGVAADDAVGGAGLDK